MSVRLPACRRPCRLRCLLVTEHRGWHLGIEFGIGLRSPPERTRLSASPVPGSRSNGTSGANHLAQRVPTFVPRLAKLPSCGRSRRQTRRSVTLLVGGVVAAADGQGRGLAGRRAAIRHEISCGPTAASPFPGWPLSPAASAWPPLNPVWLTRHLRRLPGHLPGLLVREFGVMLISRAQAQFCDFGGSIGCLVAYHLAHPSGHPDAKTGRPFPSCPVFGSARSQAGTVPCSSASRHTKVRQLNPLKYG